MKNGRFVLPMLVCLAVLASLSTTAWAAGPAAAGPKGEPVRFLAGVAGALVLVGLVVAAKAGAVAFTLCAAQLKPAIFESGRALLVASPFKSFLVGLINVVLGLIAGFALAARPVTAILGLLLLLVVLLAAILGRAIVYRKVGMALLGEPDDAEAVATPRAHLAGGAAVEIAFLAPIVGQVAMVIVTLTAVGALVRAVMSRRSGTAST